MTSPLDTVLLNQVSSLTAIAAGLEEYKDSIQQNGMSRELAVSLESYSPGIFSNTHINAFTLYPSPTKQNVALEAIDWTKAGVVGGIVSAVIYALYKFFKWLCDKIAGFFGKEEKDLRKKAKRTQTAMDNAAASATPKEPKEKEDTDKDSRSVLGKIIHPTAHPLNPVLYLLHEVGVKNKQSDKDIIKAANKLESIYDRFGDKYMGVYVALAKDFNARWFSGLLQVADVTSGKRGSRERRYDANNIVGINAAVKCSSSLLFELEAICKRFRADRLQNLGNNIEQLEAMLASVISDINTFSNTNSSIVVKIAQTKTFVSRVDGKTYTMPTKYAVEQMPRITALMEDMEVHRTINYGIWEQPNREIISPTTMPGWFEQLISKDTIDNIAAQFDLQETMIIKGMDTYRDEAAKMVKYAEKLKHELDGLSKHPVMKQLCMYPSPTDDNQRYESTPNDLVSRALMLIESINRLTSKQVLSFCILEKTLVTFTTALRTGAEDYIELLKKYQK